jgi:hypothetical protein
MMPAFHRERMVTSAETMIDGSSALANWKVAGD